MIKYNGLPDGWSWKRLTDVCEIFQGYGFPKNLQGSTSGKIPFYKVGDISKNVKAGNRFLELCDNYIDEKTLLKLRAKPYPKNTIVFAKIGEGLKLNRRAIINTPGIVGNNAIGLKALEGICNDLFLFNFLKTVKLEDYSKATTVPSVRKSEIEEIAFPLPSLSDQHAIVSKIEELLSELDKGKQQLETAQQQLKIYRQAVFNLAIKGEATIPIESIIDSLDQGWSPKCHNEPSKSNSEWCVIKTTAIQAGYFLDNENKLLPKSLEPRKQHELKKGDLLITRAGPRVRVGVCCMVKQTRPKLLNCDKVYRMRINSSVAIPEYIELLLNTPKYSKEIEKMKTGISDSGVNLTQKGFLKILLPIPSLKEQQFIVQEIESRLSVCDKVEESITTSLAQAETLRQSILKKAFEGKLI